MSRDEQVAKAQQAAEILRKLWPAKAAEIDKAIEDLLNGRRDSLTVNIDVQYKLEKFDGEYEPGKEPVEVLEGVG